MLTVKGVKKRYGDKEVLKNLTFSVPEGSIYTLVGAYGEGKTTLLNIIAGYTRADEGDIYIKDLECQSQAFKAKRLFGFVPDNFPMYEELTAKEYLEFFGHLMSESDDEQIKHLSVNLLGFVGLGSYIDTKIRRFDFPKRQKLSIARALLHNPKLIILDEPFYGMDVKEVKEIKEILDFLHEQGRTIFMTSDNLNLSASLSTAVGIMENGMMLSGDKMRKAYESLMLSSKVRDITLRNDMIKDRTIDMDAESEEFMYEENIVMEDRNAHLTRMSASDSIEEENITIGNAEQSMPDLSHTMREIPKVERTIQEMPDLSHTMHEMPDLSHTMHQMPDLSHTMHEMPDLSHTMHSMPSLEEPIRMPYEELQKIYSTRTGEDITGRILTQTPEITTQQIINHSKTGYGNQEQHKVVNKKENRLHVEKRGAGGSRVVTSKDNLRKNQSK